MKIKFKILSLLAVIMISLTFISNSSLNAAEVPFSSLEEFIKWERDLKLNARFHKDYKVPDYFRIALKNSDPESAYYRYLFLTDNPKYIEDYANIHKGQLSAFPTNGSTIIKSKYDNMPPEIAEYYKNNPNELLAAEGFGFDPVLARKVYTGEISLPYGVNKTEWLRSHAWTPNGIVEKNNVVAYAQTGYDGYNLRTSGEVPNEQARGNYELLKKYIKDMEIISKKAQVIRDSIALSLQTGTNGAASIDCSSGDVPSRFKGRCAELSVLIKAFKDLEANCEKLRSLISAVDDQVKIPSNPSAAAINKVVNKGSADIFAAEKEAADCTAPSQKGWKCLKTTIKTLEGKEYKISLKFNRPNQKSVGTIFYGVGGNGMSDMLEDVSQKNLLNQLAEQNQIRTIMLEMLEKDEGFELGGGYWIHGGGYLTLSQIFMAVWEVVVKKGLAHGDFTNYYGGSNGTMLLASAMAKYNADVFFDRVLFGIGPFLPDLASACDPNSKASFKLNNEAQDKWVQTLLGAWNYKDQNKKVCDNIKVEDRTSILKDGKKDYPNTIIHVVVGAKEDTEGFGPWFNASNLEWYNSITAKSKDRLIRPNIGHDNSPEDMLRILKLAPNETPDKTLEQCVTGRKEVDGKMVEFSCGCNLVIPGSVFQADGCYHKPL